jgi:hypothetical protein
MRGTLEGAGPRGSRDYPAQTSRATPVAVRRVFRLVQPRVTLSGAMLGATLAVKHCFVTICDWRNAAACREKCYPGFERLEPGPKQQGKNSSRIFYLPQRSGIRETDRPRSTIGALTLFESCGILIIGGDYKRADQVRNAHEWTAPTDPTTCRKSLPGNEIGEGNLPKRCQRVPFHDDFGEEVRREHLNTRTPGTSGSFRFDLGDHAHHLPGQTGSTASTREETPVSNYFVGLRADPRNPAGGSHHSGPVPFPGFSDNSERLREQRNIWANITFWENLATGKFGETS